MTRIIHIAKDFSDVPGGRFITDGDFSGEEFRDRLLAPALLDGPVQVIFDDTEGFGSSFLEEAFGGLVRKYVFSDEYLIQNIILTSNTVRASRYRRLAESFIAAALKKRRRDP